MSSKLLLQIILGVMALIPLTRGLPGALRGLPETLSKTDGFPQLDSDARFWATIWTTMGCSCYLMIPHIESHSLMFRTLMAAIFLGGISRLLSLRKYRYAVQIWLVVPLIAELIIAPLLAIWQIRISGW